MNPTTVSTIPQPSSPPEPVAPLSVSAAGFTSIGHVRRRNEDAFVIDETIGLFVVSDGMGGLQGGDVASRLVTAALPPLLRQALAQETAATAPGIRALLQEKLWLLSQAICQQGARHPMAEGMGATVVLALWTHGGLHVAHLGDSRAYLYREGRLRQLTNDHSVVALLLREGEISRREARVHPARGQLTRYMGMPEPARSDVRSLEPRSGDRLVLCSDGLFGMISNRAIRRVLEANPSPEAACRALVDAADRAGGCDNTTVIVVHFTRPPAGVSS